MALLIDYLLEASTYIRQKNEQIKKFELQYRNVYDKDIKREIELLKTEIKQKHNEIIEQLLLNLDELKNIKKYFSDLFAVFCEDEYIGTVLKKKEWLVDLVPIPDELAIQKLSGIKNTRSALNSAKDAIKKGSARISSSFLLGLYPMLSGKLSEGMYKEEALVEVEKLDSELKKQGWAIVLSDQLIQIPLNKFLNKWTITNSFFIKAKEAASKASGKGSIAETSALKNLRKIERTKIHFENIIKQILLANPVYLRNLKTSKNWLNKSTINPLELISKDLTPKSIKEQLWLREMREKLKE